MAEKFTGSAENGDEPTIEQVGGFRIQAETTEGNREVIIQGKGLIRIDSFLGDSYQLQYVRFRHDPDSGQVNVHMQGYSPEGGHNFQLPAEVLMAAIEQLRIGQGKE